MAERSEWLSPDEQAALLAGAAADPPRLPALLAAIPPDDTPAVAQALKQLALGALRRDAQEAAHLADAIAALGETAGRLAVQGLALQTHAILHTLARRDYDRALTLFDEAAAVFEAAGDELELAVSQVTRVWALACVQRYDEAFTAGAWAAGVLQRHDAHRTLAALQNNLVAIHGRRGDDAQALARLSEVLTAYEALGEEGERRLPLALINQAILLRNLGRFEESLAANERALDLATRLDQVANIARARQNMGITYFTLGRMSAAQALLEEARAVYFEDGRFRDAILTDLFITDGLLHLRRFDEVLSRCRQVRAAFAEAGTRFEVAQAWLNEAIALAGLRRYDEAATAVAAARDIFTAEQNPAWQGYADLELAALLLVRERLDEAAALLERAVPRLRDLGLPVKEAQGHLLLGQVHRAAGRTGAAHEAAGAALDLARRLDIPALAYQAHALRGRLAEDDGEQAAALAAYESAIRQIERLQGQIMVEFRADFLTDKQAVYAAAVRLCLSAGNPTAALQVAERSRSRALLELVSHRVDMRLEARAPGDEPLVARLLTLREERNRLHRRWITHEIPGNETHQQADQQTEQENRATLRRDILQLEEEIRQGWHQLLVRNRAYAVEAALWQVTPHQPLPEIPPGTALIDYYIMDDDIVAFVATSGRVDAYPLTLTAGEAGRLQQQLKHAFDTVRRAPTLAAVLRPKADRLLEALFDGLLAPFYDAVRDAGHLIFIPSGPLHYLPWHAMRDEAAYLLARHQVSVLPSALLLDEIGASGDETGEEILLLGHTDDGRLPHIAAELEAIGRSLGATPRLDEAATRARLLAEATGCGLLHIASHGEFRRADPLFSGLQLHDGLLTTLDIFNLRLRASLVCLSACETGRVVVGGGDELFGLMRAFLAGGAASLVMSLWRVDDASTAALMVAFYEELMAGAGKGEALRRAQMALIGREDAAAHPYFWAPFFLVGDPGPLPERLRVAARSLSA